MLALAAAIAFQNTKLPENAVVRYSGIPTVTGQNIAIQSHTVTITVAKDYVVASSLTLVKNNGAAGVASVSFPGLQVGGVPASLSNFEASWAGKPQPVAIAYLIDKSGKPVLRTNSYTISGAMQNLGSYALRISYRVPIGKSGFDHKQFLAAYDLTSPAPIGTLMVTYNYAPGVVFHEPDAGPNIGWQIGLKGAFVKIANYDGKAGLSYCAFYAGGFGG